MQTAKMQLSYLHGNPVKKPAKKASKKASKAPKALSVGDIKKIQAEARKASKTIAKKVTKKVSKQAKKASTTSGEETMAKKKKVAKKAKSVKRKIARKVAKKATKKVARKVAKKAKKVARKVARKATRKVARKASVKRAVRKVARKTRRKARKSTATIKAVGGKITRRKRKFKRTGRGMGGAVLAKHTKLSNNARKLKKGQTLVETVEYAPKRRKNKKTGKVSISAPKRKQVTIKALNPKRRKGRNPIIQSNPRFMKNPIGAVIGMENKLLNAGLFKKADAMTKKFLNVGVLEVAGLAVGSAFDGQIVKGFDMLSAKVPMVGEMIGKIPAKFKAPALTGLTGVGLHLLNSFLAKKSGKKSQVLDELSRGLIASALVKGVASLSPMSVENSGMAGYVQSMSGTVFAPHSMSGYVMSNPSASMPTANSDFSGADFEGADYGTSSVGGADFEGMGMIENAMDADDYGSDVHAVSGLVF